MGIRKGQTENKILVGQIINNAYTFYLSNNNNNNNNNNHCGGGGDDAHTTADCHNPPIHNCIGERKNLADPQQTNT